MNVRQWTSILLLTLPMVALAQNAVPPSMNMDHMSMPGMDHRAMPDGPADTGPRSADYSDGIEPSHVPGMDMHDDQPLAMLLVDQLEFTHGRDGDGQAWDVQGWYGNDSNKLWLRSEGERNDGRLGDGQVELLWDHATTAFWNTQLGLRQDVGDASRRRWAAFGIRGLAPYWFELEATAYAGSSGRTAARLRVEYELRFTRRWILQPEAELNLYGRNDVASRIGSGLANAQLGLRLRYEIRRELAPYIGVVWKHRYGTTAGYARADGQKAMDRQIVAGVRLWF